MAAPTFQEYFNAGRAEAINRRPDLTFDEGDISEFVVAGLAAMADHLTGYFAARFKATYLDGAEGDDLTTLADDHWNIQRFPAVPAGGNVTFSRTAGLGAPAGTILAGSIVATQKDSQGNEIQFTTDFDVNWTLGDVADKVVHVTAVNAGILSNCDIGKVSRIVTPSPTFDSTISVLNPTDKMAGGEDEETDADLRERVRSLPATLRRGTLGAIEYGAQNVTGVKKATAIEEFDTLGRQTGIVDLYISDSSGNSNPTMVSNVSTEEQNWRPAGSVLNVYGGLLQTQNVIVQVVARLGTDTQALVTNIVAAVTARVNKLKIGETLSPDIIKQAVLNVDDTLLSVAVTSPAVPVVPPAGTLIRCGTVSVS